MGKSYRHKVLFRNTCQSWSSWGRSGSQGVAGGRRLVFLYFWINDNFFSFFELMTKNKVVGIFCLKSNVSVTGSTTPRLRTRLTPLAVLCLWNNIRTLTLLTQSQDMNPIKNLWRKVTLEIVRDIHDPII